MIIMPYFHLAGDTNNPAIQGPKNGYSVAELERFGQTEGLQNGEISIFGLTAIRKY